MLPDSLTNFEIQNYYQNEPNFNRVYLKSNLTNIKNGTYEINFDGHQPVGTHCIVLYVQGDNVSYVDRFGVEHMPKEIKN